MKVPIEFFNEEKCVGIKRGGSLFIVERDLRQSPSPSPPPGSSRPDPRALPGALATYRPDLLDETAL